MVLSVSPLTYRIQSRRARLILLLKTLVEWAGFNLTFGEVTHKTSPVIRENVDVHPLTLHEVIRVDGFIVVWVLLQFC